MQVLEAEGEGIGVVARRLMMMGSPGRKEKQEERGLGIDWRERLQKWRYVRLQCRQGMLGEASYRRGHAWEACTQEGSRRYMGKRPSLGLLWSVY